MVGGVVVREGWLFTLLLMRAATLRWPRLRVRRGMHINQLLTMPHDHNAIGFQAYDGKVRYLQHYIRQASRDIEYLEDYLYSVVYQPCASPFIQIRIRTKVTSNLLSDL